MSCQTCPRPATGTGITRGFRVRCCSAECARTLTAGIHVAEPGTVYVAAASPLGSIISAKLAAPRAGYVVAEKVAAQLVGAMQRIGPQQKRDASDAALPAAAAKESTQEEIDWTTTLPPELWARILPALEHADLRKFASRSQAAADLTNMDVVQAEKYRQTRTPYRAAVHYMNPRTPAHQRTVIRRAFPNVAEMALALMMVHANEANYQMNITSGQDISRWFQSMRREAKLMDGALFQRPIQLPFRGRKIVGAAYATDGTAPVMAGALLYYFEFLTVRLFEPSAILNQLHTAVWQSIHHNVPAHAAFPVESPASVSFFNVPHIADFDMPMYQPPGNLPIAEFVAAGGVDLTRRDTLFWAFSTSYRFGYAWAIADYVAANATIRFDQPRTNGQLSYMQMAIDTEYDPDFLSTIAESMFNKQQLHQDLVAPCVAGAASGHTCFFRFTSMSDELFTRLVEIADGCETETADDPPRPLISPFIVRAASTETPFEYYLTTLVASEIAIAIGASENTMAGSMIWDPFAPAPGTNIPVLATLAYTAQNEIVEAIIMHTDPEFIDTASTLEYIRLLLAVLKSSQPIANDALLALIALLQKIIYVIPTNSLLAQNYAREMDPALPQNINDSLARFT